MLAIADDEHHLALAAKGKRFHKLKPAARMRFAEARRDAGPKRAERDKERRFGAALSRLSMGF